MRLTRFVPVLISIALLAVLLSHFEGFDLLLGIHVPLFALAVVISLALNAFVGAYKWRSVMGLSDIRAGYWEIWRLWLGLYPITFIMPFQSGHVLYAVALKKAKNVSYFAAFESVAYDKYLNVVATVALIGLGQIFIDPTHMLSNIWIALGALAVIAFYLADRHVIRALSSLEFVQRRSRLFQGDKSLGKKIYLLILATIYQSTDVISMFLACRCLGIDVSFLSIFGIFPIVHLLSYVPLTFMGFGAREGLIVLTMGGLLTYDQSVASGLLVNLLEYVVPALFGLVALVPTYRVLTSGTDSLRAKLKQKYRQWRDRFEDR